MIRAIKQSGYDGYQCVVPKEIDHVTAQRIVVMPQTDCWTKCGRKRGWAGKCDYCGGQGYCCNADGRGNCPTVMNLALAVQGYRGMRCVRPSNVRTDHRLESTKRSKCFSTNKTQCRTLSSFINGKKRGGRRSWLEDKECPRFFSEKDCNKMVAPRTESSDPTSCLTTVTNYCDSEPSSRHHSRAVTETANWAEMNVYQKEMYKYA